MLIWMIEKMPPKAKVCILTASLGAGHNQAARAVEEGLRQVAPSLDLSLQDVLSFSKKFFLFYYRGAFLMGMTKAPLAWGLGFWLTNRPNRPGRVLMERLRLKSERRAMEQLRSYLLTEQPSLIINTHFLCPPIVGRMISDGQLKARQVVVITDVEVHRWWYSENIDHWFAPADYSAEKLLQWGIPQDRVTVSGIPLRPKWTAPLPSSERILADWQLPAGRPIVLLSGGTEFTAAPVLKIARGIAQVSPQACVVILCGRNKELLAKASGLGLPDRIRPMGFTDRMPELAAVASLMVTKPGGITTAECLSKGLPMVFLRPVPGQEGGNAKYYQRQGAGVITTSVKRTVETVRGLLDDPAALARMAQAAKGLYRPATKIICDKILSML